MATSIEDQIHHHFVELEAEKARVEGRKPRAVPKQWARFHPQALCVEPDLLQWVKEYDYRLDDQSFQAYCRARGVLDVAGVSGSRRWQFIAEHSRFKKDDYLADPYFQFAEESEGARHKYTVREMEVGWQVIELGRARLQDCWEIYQAAHPSPQ